MVEAFYDSELNFLLFHYFSIILFTVIYAGRLQNSSSMQYFALMSPHLG